MAQQGDQNLQNHTANDPKMISALLLGVIAIILGAMSIFTDQLIFLQVAVLDICVSVLLIGVTARSYSTKVQDRIIRTEMKIRLRDILDSELANRAEALTMKQLIGLRFASDSEMPGLVARVLDENIETAGEIKKLVTDWQGDYDRV